MQVDRKGVGEADGDLAQRVCRAGILAQQDAVGIAPVDLGGVQQVAGVVQYAQPILFQEADVALDFRQLVLAQNGWRHRPGRIQGQVADPRLEQRSGSLRPPHLGAGLPHRLLVAVIGNLRAGDIDHHHARLQLAGLPAQTLEIDPHLIAALRRADVQLGQSGRADHSIGLQVVLALEGLDGIDQQRVVQIDIRDTCPGRDGGLAQVAFAGQALFEQQHTGIALARAQQGPGGNARPARQRLSAQLRPDATQVAIGLELRTGPLEGRGQIVQALGGEARRLDRASGG
ncbi:hypothetical protein D3C78_1151870 [compost metagenome]